MKISDKIANEMLIFIAVTILFADVQFISLLAKNI